MNPEIQKILDKKIESIHYYSQSKDRIQLIHVVLQKSQVIEPSDIQAIIDYLKSQLSSATVVTVHKNNPPNFTIYIEVPEHEDLEPLRALHQKLKKTP